MGQNGAATLRCIVVKLAASKLHYVNDKSFSCPSAAPDACIASILAGLAQLKQGKALMQ